MDDLELRQILFATDYSDVSANAGVTAAQLARRFGARLHVVHVVPPVTDPGPADALAAAIGRLGSDLDAVTAVLTGPPAREIVQYARRQHVDLIVMGTHGRTGVSRALLGSVAEAVVRRAPCRVLTVPDGLRVRASVATRQRGARKSGSEMVKVVPRPTAESTSMVPPWSRTMP
jgi:nucleotide-binding universal stress UspA family protein